MIEKQRARLLDILKKKAVLYGDFVLASGKRSSYYIDGRLVTLEPEGAYLTARLILDVLKDDSIDAVGGPCIGADPIVGATIAASYIAGRPLLGFLVRKAEKTHGTQRRIEGPLREGMRVAMLEDVVTTGTSVLDAVKEVEKAGGRVVKVISLIDRMKGARELFAENGYEFVALFTRKDLGIGEDSA
ncbi:MAG TPA: orotate phosphoribosyltransferase [Planctomycetota bacterium]|nr:orotate phosphoribosyltransferase [Planctomycetota bacterium]